MGRGTLGEVWDGLRDRQGGPERVVGPSWRCKTARGTLGEVRSVQGTLPEIQDGLENPNWRFGMGRETL